MIRSFYTATSGAMTENKNLSIVSNNLANLQTSGFKRDAAVSSTFAEKLLVRLAKADSGYIGPGRFVRALERTYTDYSQGALDETERALDFAIIGDGYFAVERDNNEVWWTRSGEFYLDDMGFLCHIRGGYILSEDSGMIRLNGADFEVDQTGNIIQDGQLVAKLGVFAPTEDAGDEEEIQLRKIGEGFFAPTDIFERLEAPQIKWHTLERSNANMSQEMSQALVSSRQFQTYSQLMKMIDEITGQTVTEIARPT